MNKEEDAEEGHGELGTFFVLFLSTVQFLASFSNSSPLSRYPPTLPHEQG
jgi:hypothetical protein